MANETISRKLQHQTLQKDTVLSFFLKHTN